MITLSQFIEVCEGVFGEPVSSETWIYADLGCDDDEFGWAIMALAKRLNCRIDAERDVYEFLPQTGGFWWQPRGYADLRVRELFAFLKFEELA